MPITAMPIECSCSSLVFDCLSYPVSGRLVAARSGSSPYPLRRQIDKEEAEHCLAAVLHDFEHESLRHSLVLVYL